MQASQFQIPVDLVKDVAEGSIVLFLGNDLPAQQGDWQGPPNRLELAQALAQRYPWVQAAHDLTQAVEDFFSHEPPDEHSLRSFVCESVNRPGFRPGPLHQAVVELGFDAVVSRAFDDLLETALKAAGRRVLTVVDDQEIAYAGGKQEAIVIRLAGSVDRPGSLVLSERDQIRVENHLSEKLQAVRGWCSLRPLLFVGWDPDDDHLLRLFNAATEKLGPHKRRNYIVWPGTARKAAAWRRDNVEIIQAEALDFLGELARRVEQERLASGLPGGYRAGEVVRKPPYKFLNFFELADRDIFCGREVEAPLVYRLALSHPLLVLFGQSGVGKTSLLLAGVAPLLLADGYRCAYVRALGDPLLTIRETVVEALKPGLKEDEKRRLARQGPRLADFFAAMLGAQGRMAVMLDQFEELYTRRRSAAARLDFWQQVGECLAGGAAEVRFLLSLREDFLAHLDEARKAPGEGLPAPVPTILRNSYRLTALEADTAYLAIVEPARRARCEVEPLLAQVLLGQASMPDGQAEAAAGGEAPLVTRDEPAQDVHSQDDGPFLEIDPATGKKWWQRLWPARRGEAVKSSAQSAVPVGAARERAGSQRPAAAAGQRWSLLEVDGSAPPPALQIVMDALYRDALQAGGHVLPQPGQADWQPPALHLTLPRYRELGGAGRILADYVHRALDDVPRLGGERALAEALLKVMVTSQKTKAALHEKDLLDGLAESQAVFDPKQDLEALHTTRTALLELRLLRSFRLGEEAYYELAHDHLADEIAAWISQEEMQARLARELLRSELDKYQRLGLLIAPQALGIIHAQAEALKSLQAKELELLLRSALAAGCEAAYWFERAAAGGVAVATIALEGLKVEDYRGRAAAVDALGKLLMEKSEIFQISDFWEALLGCLADEYPQVRVAAMRALESLQPSGEWRAHLKYECYVPAGEFVMGDDKSGESDQKPAHKVHLEAFYVGKYPVTNADYRRFMQARGSTFEVPQGKEHHPVVNVNWYEARQYAHWAGMRLLTEAQWEKAASWEVDRGSGNQVIRGRQCRYPWGDKFDKGKCNTSEAGPGTTTPVGRYSPGGDSPWGCADMAGNAWEWTSSLKRAYPYRAEDGREDAASGDNRVLRGGSWDAIGARARCACRRGLHPGGVWYSGGFRVGVVLRQGLAS